MPIFTLLFDAANPLLDRIVCGTMRVPVPPFRFDRRVRRFDTQPRGTPALFRVILDKVLIIPLAHYPN